MLLENTVTSGERTRPPAWRRREPVEGNSYPNSVGGCGRGMDRPHTEGNDVPFGLPSTTLRPSGPGLTRRSSSEIGAFNSATRLCLQQCYALSTFSPSTWHQGKPLAPLERWDSAASSGTNWQGFSVFALSVQVKRRPTESAIRPWRVPSTLVAVTPNTQKNRRSPGGRRLEVSGVRGP